MSYERTAIIQNESGIHARVAAGIVQRAKELAAKYGTRGERFELHSIMKLIALKARQGDTLFVTAEGGREREAAGEMAAFLEGDLEMHEQAELREVDKLLHENALMQERLQMILEAVQDGICVVEKSGIITYVNPAYLRIVHKTREMVLGQNVFESAPDGNRVGVLKSGVARIGALSHKKNGTTVVANVNPIFVDGEIAGVVSVIKDITEIQNLMERLTQVSARAEYLEQELLRTKKTATAFSNYIGKSGKVVDVLALATKAAASTATVLIRGESGTRRSSPRASTTRAGGGAARSSASTAAPSRRPCSKANSSAMSAAHSRVPSSASSASSSSRTTARSSSTKSPRWTRTCRSSCCACCSRKNSTASAARRPCTSMSASSRRRTATSRP